MEKPPVRCSECDREMEHYNIFLSPTNEEKVICWECWDVKKKAFLRNAAGGAKPVTAIFRDRIKDELQITNYELKNPFIRNS